MTYDELLLGIATDAPKLSDSALRVLLALIATSIESGSPDVAIGKQRLADRTGLSREGVARGTRDLQSLIPAQATNGVHTLYALPPEWFAPQRSLFAVAGTVEKRVNLPTNQAAPANQPGSSCQPTRQLLPTN